MHPRLAGKDIKSYNRVVMKLNRKWFFIFFFQLGIYWLVQPIQLSRPNWLYQLAGDSEGTIQETINLSASKFISYNVHYGFDSQRNGIYSEHLCFGTKKLFGYYDSILQYTYDFWKVAIWFLRQSQNFPLTYIYKTVIKIQWCEKKNIEGTNWYIYPLKSFSLYF